MHQNRIHRRRQAIPTDFSGVVVYQSGVPEKLMLALYFGALLTMASAARMFMA